MRPREGGAADKPPCGDLDAELARIAGMNIDALRLRWRTDLGRAPPQGFSRDGLARALAYRVQEQWLGGLPPCVVSALAAVAKGGDAPARRLKVGTVLRREHAGALHEVTVVPDGFRWRGETYASLSAVARRITGTVWSGARFFGVKGEIRPAAASVVRVDRIATADGSDNAKVRTEASRPSRQHKGPSPPGHRSRRPSHEK